MIRRVKTMTRLWKIDPVKLCQQHLLGEHAELHQEVGTLLNHPHGEAIVRGHAEKGQVDTSLIQERHDELAVELQRRGLNHESPLDFNDTLGIGYVDVEANKIDLAERCEDCKELMDV